MNTTKLILDNLNFANFLARKHYKKVPKCVSYEELQSAAYFGLVMAAKRFDNKRKFLPYASRRIVGEIQDYLRSLRYTRSMKHKFVDLENYF